MKKSPGLIAIFVALIIPLTALADEWVWTDQPTPGAQNESPSEESTSAPSYTNGTLSDAILLSEIMPNPEGTDTDTEWIELYNASTANVDLGNWSLDDEEGGSDPYIFPAGTVVEAQDFLVISRSVSKLSLNNDTDTVRLFNFQNTAQDSVTYDGSPEGQSYARIGVEEWAGANTGGVAWRPTDSLGHRMAAKLVPTAHAEAWFESDWEWTQDTTVGAQNPIYYFIEGTIKEWVPFEDRVRVESKKGALELSLASLTLNPELKATVFEVGQTIQGYATQKSDQTWELRKIADANFATGPSEDKTKNSLRKTILLMAGALVVGFGYLLVHKKP